MQVRQTNLLADYNYGILAMLTTHDTLVRFDAALQPVPQLARSWQVSENGRLWRFHLRTDATWHDGQPVTAGDVKFTFEYLAAHQPASAWINDLLDDIHIEDTVISFRLKKPFSRFLINGGFIIRILPRHVWMPVGDPFQPGSAAITVGSGPYIFEEFDLQRSRIIFRRNPHYYGSPGAMDYLEFSLNRTFDSLVLDLIRGDIDLYYKYASGFQASFLPRLEKEAGVNIVQQPDMGIPAVLGFNLRNKAMNCKNFRKALSLALDYRRIGQSLAGDAAMVPSGGFIPPAFAYQLPLPALVYNPDESRRLLEKTGYTDTDKDGFRNRPGGANLVLTLLARGDLEGTDGLLPIIVYNARQVGIDIRIEKTDLSTWTSRMQQNLYDLVLFRTTPWGMVMEAGCGSGYFDSRRRGGGTLANIVDPGFHELCDRVLGATRQSAQATLYHEIQRYYAKNLPALALCWTMNSYPAGKRLVGLSVNQIEGGLINRRALTILRRSGPGE